MPSVPPGPTGESHKERVQRHLDHIEDRLKGTKGLGSARRKEYHRAAKDVFANMTEKAMTEYDKEVKSYHFYKSQKELSDALGEDAVGGYDPNDGSIHLDGKEPGQTLAALYGHEMAHGLDGQHDQYSKQAGWRKAWKKEMVKKPFNNNAKKDASEGWAEFGERLLGGWRAGRLLLGQTLPKLYEVLEEQRTMAEKVTSPRFPDIHEGFRTPDGKKCIRRLPAEVCIANIDRWKRDYPEMAADPFWGPHYEQARAELVEELTKSDRQA
jgi:hypothetical protein